ncbi:hypothetical protein LWI29_023445 [Acer saccharum]|uniref:Uncharacterized protein n=1 Tax=Acer saccharum TaxID=4024 RepID=A0AA39T5V0_ACESA|nr:hypothetical protein LWI29_023445 [Acer saccharum]
MFGCECFYWNRLTGFDEFNSPEPELFSLPSPLPQWPQGKGFATGKINLGELEVTKITKFESIWSCTVLHGKGKAESKGVTFYKPVEIPDGFHCLGHYCQPNDHPLRGYVLVARMLLRNQKMVISIIHHLTFQL